MLGRRNRLVLSRRWDDMRVVASRAGLLALCLVSLVACFVPFIRWPRDDVVVRIVAGAVVLTGGVTLMRWRRPDLSELAVGPSRAISPSDVEIRASTRYVVHTYDGYALDCFVNLLLDLPRFLSRVHEEAELVGRMLLIRTKLQYRIDLPPTPVADREPTAGGGYVLVPVVTARKGLLFDGFVATGSGPALPTLSQSEVRGLAAFAVQALFLLALRDTRRHRVLPPDPQAWLAPGDEKIMYRVIEKAVCQVAHDSHEQADSEAALAALDTLSGAISPHWRAKLISICRALARSYIIVAEVPLSTGRNLVVHYSSLYSPERMSTSRYEGVRARWGLRPSTIDVAMTRALHADSYHFELTAPSGTYVYSHHLELLGHRDPWHQDTLGDDGRPPYIELYQEEGRTNAHLHVRRQGSRPGLMSSPQTSLPDLKSVVYLHEIPPGALGNAATLAVTTSVILLFFALTRVGLDTTAGAAGLPALVLAVPAFVASALGRGMDQDKIGRTSLTAYFGLVTVAALSVFAVMLYILDASRTLPTEVRLHLVTGTELHTDLLWLGLTLASSTIAAYLLRERRNESKYYLSMLRSAALKRADGVGEGS